MTFFPRMYWVNVYGINDKDSAKQAVKRAEYVLGFVDKAASKIGGKPTHVLMDHSMLINLDMLEQAGLKIERRPFPRGDRMTVKLAREHTLMEVAA